MAPGLLRCVGPVGWVGLTGGIRVKGVNDKRGCLSGGVVTAIAFVTCPGASSEGLGVGSDEPLPFPPVKTLKLSERSLKVEHAVGVNAKKCLISVFVRREMRLVGNVLCD